MNQEISILIILNGFHPHALVKLINLHSHSVTIALKIGTIIS